MDHGAFRYDKYNLYRDTAHLRLSSIFVNDFSLNGLKGTFLSG